LDDSLAMQIAVSSLFPNLGGRELQRLVSASFAMFIHAALFLILMSGLAVRPLGQISHDLKVAIIAEPEKDAGTPPPPPFRDPVLLNVLPPDVVIDQALSPNTENSQVASIQLLAPRPDPDRPNMRPSYPAGVAISNGNKTIIVIVKAFVLKDGTIRDCAIAGSSGVAALDKMAVDFVEKRWHFLPASLDGKPIDDWTTVEVTFG
jgi:TonB family protein